MVTRKVRPKKKSVEVNKVAPTRLEIQTRRSSEIERISIKEPVTSQPIEYSSLKWRRLTSSKTYATRKMQIRIAITLIRGGIILDPWFFS